MKHFLAIMLCMYGVIAHSSEIKHRLVIDTKVVNFSGTPANAMAINGSIPGPTLEFTEGDVGVIDVVNNTDDEASIHWHGLLLPQDQDGVPYLTMFPIDAGTTYQYRFELSHPGTYWYHSHTKIDEQKGQYGAIVVHPKSGYNERVDHDIVVQLSDWTDEDPYDVLKNLKKDGDWYGYKKDSVISLAGYLEHSDLSAWFNNRWMRMEGMDVSDVGYDAFLANGQKALSLVPDAKVGDKIKLRIINSAASSIFDIVRSQQHFKIVAADGVDVQPVHVKRFQIAMAETYDVIVTIPDSGAMEFAANNIDGTGGVKITLGTGDKVPSPDPKKPNLFLAMDHGEHGAHGEHEAHGSAHDSSHGSSHDNSQHSSHDMGHGTHQGSDHSAMQHNSHGGSTDDTAQDSSQNSAQDSAKNSEPNHSHHKHHADMGTSMDMNKEMSKQHQNYGNHQNHMNHKNHQKTQGLSEEPRVQESLEYKMLKSAKPVKHQGKVQEYSLELTGDMENYNWSFNNKPLSKADVLKIERGNVVQFHFINKTMMNHPLHLHGHFFKVLSGNGDHDVIKHTVNVEPMVTVTIKFAANEYKDWFFHCHNLYHAKTGMSRVIRYSDYAGNPEFTKAKMMSNEIMDSDWYSRGDVSLFTNHGAFEWRQSNYEHAIQLEAERHFEQQHSEYNLQYNYRTSTWMQYFVGYKKEGEEEHLEFGIKYVLPFSIETTSWLNDDGGIHFEAETEFQLTKHLGLEIEVSTESEWEYNLEYRQSPQWSIALNHNNVSGVGLGVTATF